MYAAPHMDLGLFTALLVLFATLVTTHVLLCLVLMKKAPRLGVIALLVPPLAPYWGSQQKIRTLPAIWLTSASCYFFALIIAFI